MTTQSDLRIPRLSDILDRALDSRESAVRLQDEPTIAQLDRVIANAPRARLCWQLGTLVVDSPSGQQYQVTRGGCSCKNARKGFRRCWHVALFELLLDMFETDCETADMEAACDPPGEESPLGPDEGDELPSGWRIGRVVRQAQLESRLAATAQYLETLRSAQQRPAEPTTPHIREQARQAYARANQPAPSLPTRTPWYARAATARASYVAL